MSQPNTPSPSGSSNNSTHSPVTSSSPIDHYNAITDSQRQYIEDYHHIHKKTAVELGKLLNIQTAAVCLAITQIEIDKKYGKTEGRIKVTDCKYKHLSRFSLPISFSSPLFLGMTFPTTSISCINQQAYR